MLLLDMHVETILEYMNDGFVAIDKEWRYVYVNAKAEAILQKQRKDMLGHEVAKVFPDIGNTPFTERCLHAFETGEIVEFESYYESLHVWMYVRICPVAEGLFIYFHDVTANRMVNQQVDETLAFLVESAPFGFAFFDMDLRFRHINKQMALINNIPEEEHIGKTLKEVLSGHGSEIVDSDAVTDIMQAVLENDLPVLDLEISGVPQAETGGVKYWLVSYYPVHSLTGELIGVSTYVLDITERKALDQRKDEFINMASHELKTPLTSIKTMVQMLRRKLVKQNLQEHVASLTRMDSQADTLTKLIGELLDVSKMRTGNLDYMNEAVDINELLTELIEVLQPTMPQHMIVLTGEACKPIHGDRERLKQVFTNLLTNAAKYSPDAEYVDVHIGASESGVVTSVRDYGIGIPKDMQKKIFERFYRAPMVRDSSFPGLGMGLYIVEAIVKRHGGKITVESEEGEGSTFSVFLPC